MATAPRFCQYIIVSRLLFMDPLPTYLNSFYFWIPFYCFLLLLIVNHSRLEFYRICAALAMYELMAGLGVVIINGVSQQYLFAPVALTFGAAAFCSLYLRKRLITLKLCLFMWSGMIIYDHLGNGLISQETIIISILFSMVMAMICSRYLKFNQ